MRVRITIDHEDDLPPSIAETAQDFSRHTELPVEQILETETSLWWGWLAEQSPDVIRVEVVD